jgi:hypothetical protein
MYIIPYTKQSILKMTVITRSQSKSQTCSQLEAKSNNFDSPKKVYKSLSVTNEDKSTKKETVSNIVWFIRSVSNYLYFIECIKNKKNNCADSIIYKKKYRY